MRLDNCSTDREPQRHRSNVKVTGPDCRILYHCEMGEKFVYTMTGEPLYEHVRRQPPETYLFSRSSVKGQCYFFVSGPTFTELFFFRTWENRS